MSPRPSQGSRYSPDSGSHAIALTVKSRRRDGLGQLHRRIARDVEAAVPAPRLRLASRQRDIDVARLVDLEAFADGLDAAQGLEDAVQAIGRHAEDLDVDVFAVASHQPIAHPAAHDERAAARLADRLGDLLRAIESR